MRIIQTLIFCALSSALPLAGATFCVNPAGPTGCVKTIGAAVTAASPGDIVNVAQGTYTETVTIGKAITLLGTDPTKTIINAAGLPNGIYVDGIDNKGLTGVTISGFTVENGQFEGILVANASGIILSGNIVSGNNKALVIGGGQMGMNACPGMPAFETNEGDDCGEGIHLSGVSNSSILNNTVQNNAGGILLSDDTGATFNNMISGNTVMNNVLDCGITLASHVPATLTGSATPLGVYSNAVMNNVSTGNGQNGSGAGVGIFSSAPGCQSYGNLVANNTLTGNGLPGVTIHGHAPGQLLDGNVIIGNTISGNGADVFPTATPGTAGITVNSVSQVNGTVIAQNTITNEVVGVAWSAPGNANVQRNSFADTYGIYNLSPGTINADSNWWGCNGNPTNPSAFFAGCSETAGQVTVTTWMTAPSH